jgi:leucyl/phenylalanyl-tRNA---protein transferase
MIRTHVREPVALPACRWSFPAADDADADGLVAVGADLEPSTLVEAYRRGIFPMPVAGHLAWWSPDPRGILPPDGFRISRSLRRTRRRFEIQVDRAFPDVVSGCADPRRPGGWITPAVRRAYVRLHELGWAHSVEAWAPDGRLAGGVYGVAVGGLFAAESMFHREPDASKAALAALCERLRETTGDVLLDVQWCTPALARLGAREIPRADYLQRLAAAVGGSGPHMPHPRMWHVRT